MPLGVTDRDAVQNVCRRDDEATSTTYLLYQTTTHPARPEDKKIVRYKCQLQEHSPSKRCKQVTLFISLIFRAEAIFAGAIIRPDPDDPGSSVLSVMMQTDMKGLIPHFIVNTFAAHAPAEWHSCLSNYYKNVYLPQQQGAQ